MPINFPFDIKFYGDTYTQFVVSANGFITFDLSFFQTSYSNHAIPFTDLPNNFIAQFWDDLDGRVNGEVYYQHIGDRFIIQWDHWGHFPLGTEDLTFQIVLSANSGLIEFVYADMDSAQTDATVGIENPDGTIGLQIAYNAA